MTAELFEKADDFISAYEMDALKLERLQIELSDLKGQAERQKPQIELLGKVRLFLQTLAEATRDEVMAGLQSVVTICLQSVFGPELSFEIEVETKRNNTGIEFYVVNTSGEHTVRMTPEDNMGGGVIDTISIGLRFGLLKVLNPAPEGPIFLDEPAKMVSADRVGSIANLLKELSSMFDRQIILVTHHTSFMDVVDHALHVELERGSTKIS